MMTLALVAVVLVITYMAYLPGLSGPFLFDDRPQLEPIINQVDEEPESLWANHLVSGTGPLGRPVAMASFIGSALGHGPDTWWWKHQNLMLHLVSGLLVFWCVALLFGQVYESRDARPWLAGAIGAAFWMLHPLHVSTVLLTVQRMMELSTLFVLAGMIAYIKGRQRLLVGDYRGWLAIAAAFAVFFPLGVLSKESALLFPAFCGLIEVFVFRFAAGGRHVLGLKALHAAFIGVYAIAVIYVLVNLDTRVLGPYVGREFGLLERVYTEFRVMVLYLGQLLLPAQGKMGFFHDGVRHSTGLVEPVTTLLSAALLLTLAGLAFWLRRRVPLFAFGIAFFFVAHALESTIFALELMFEHRNYLASFGLIVAIGALLQTFITNRRGLLAFVVVGLAAFSLLTWQRSVTWSSPETMYEFMYRVHPESPRLNVAFADAYAQAREYDIARDYLANIRYGLGPAIHLLYLDCLQRGDVEEQKVRDIERRTDGAVDGHVTSAVKVLVEGGVKGTCRLPQAAVSSMIDHLLTLSARSGIDRKSLYLSKGSLLESQDDIAGAVTAYESAYEMQPGNAQSLYIAANALSLNGELDKAAGFLTSAYAVESAGGIQNKRLAMSMYLNLGGSFAANGEFEKALAVYTEGIASVPGATLIYLRKVELLVQLGRYQEAAQILDNRRMLDAAETGEYARIIQQLREILRSKQE